MRRLSPGILEECVEMARPILVEIAKAEMTIKYKQLMNMMGNRPGRGYIAEVLEQISRIEYKAGHPKLSAVVVRADTGMVGGGFFGLPGTPESIRRSNGEWQNPRLSKADEAYWQDELRKVYYYWRHHDC